MRRHLLWRAVCVTPLFVVVFTALSGPGLAVAQQDATPAAYSCETAGTPKPGMGTPVAGMEDGGMDMGTPAADAAFDQLYIDMMIPHHASIVALAQTALPRLTDERLRKLAGNIINAQTAEIDELRGYREQFYGGAWSMPMDDRAMMRVMPGMTMPMDEMKAQMDAATQVTIFCAASDADLAFIDLTIPHHLSAIAASEEALQEATHDEIRTFAGKVIEDQQRELDELSTIRRELYGSATPQAFGA